MDIITVDFETYYDQTYSLTKLTTEEYVRDPRFEIIGVAIKVNDAPACWYSHSEYHDILRRYDWASSAVLCHNTAFDGAILSWRFGIKPKLWLDTLSMARPHHMLTCGVSLAALAQEYGLGHKGRAVHDARGKHRSDFTPNELSKYSDYCLNDCELTYKLFQKLRPKTPKQEMIIIDQTIRMFTEPTFEFDTSVLTQHLKEVQERKAALLARMHTVDPSQDAKTILMSNDKFAEFLRELGVEPPTKISKTTGKTTWAFAKSDKEFLALQEHDNVDVQAAVAARLGVKSTLEETRTESFLRIASRGRLPIPLGYWKAHCVTGDVEVLSELGWVRLDAWSGGRIAQYEPASGTVIFAEAKKFIGPICNEWVRSVAPYMPVHLTPGHTVAYKTHGSSEHAAMTAAELAARATTHIPTGGLLSGTADTITPDQIRVLAMVQADGSYCLDAKQGRGLRISLTKARKQQRARNLLTMAGIKFREASYPSHPGEIRFSIAYADLPAWLSHDRKAFGPWLLTTSAEAREALLVELRYWDGWVNGGQTCYSSSEKTNVEWIQTVAHLSGKSAKFTTVAGIGNRRDNYILRIRDRDYCEVKRKHTTWICEAHRAYCAETITGFWLARSGGHIFVTGNTGRFAGEEKINMQNLPRGGNLRKSICAPPGKVVITADASQIEARIIAWLAGQNDLLDAFRESRDVYSEFACEVYGRTITKDDKPERFVGKTCILGLGYGMGPPKFRHTLAIGQGGISVQIDDIESSRIVQIYRSKNHRIKAFWYICNDAIKQMAAGNSGRLIEHADIHYTPSGIILPSGLPINYPNLRSDGTQYIYDARKKPTKIYGGKMAENITQALAQDAIKQVMIRLRKHMPIVLQVHDEIVAVVPEPRQYECIEVMREAMVIPPYWAPDLPVACETGKGKSYGDSK